MPILSEALVCTPYQTNVSLKDQHPQAYAMLCLQLTVPLTNFVKSEIKDDERYARKAKLQ